MTCTNFARALPGSLLPGPKLERISLKVTAVLFIAAALPVALLTTAHVVPEFGSFAADSLREVLGVEGVAQLEDTVYGVRDSVNQVTKAGDEPRSYWAPPSKTNDDPVAANNMDSAKEELRHSFTPAPATIPFPEVSAPLDGEWVDVVPGENSLKKTLIHPDPERTWAELFVVAIDLAQIKLNWIPGLHEPENRADHADDYQRTGRIPSNARPQLIAAFNGGFKTQHGKFGAQIDGITLVAPRPHLCTLAQTHDGHLLLGTHTSLNTSQALRWLRQTPGCMVENGELHPGLAREDTKNWGATLEGGTVIRRSAIGMSSDQTVLYMGISNDTTARALARGMQSAGANTVAQLDVNQSYPKFVFFEHHAEKSTPRSLVEGFAFKKDQYLKAEERDFFYLTKAR